MIEFIPNKSYVKVSSYDQAKLIYDRWNDMVEVNSVYQRKRKEECKFDLGYFMRRVPFDPFHIHKNTSAYTIMLGLMNAHYKDHTKLYQIRWALEALEDDND